jgi:hypothetical protein
MTAPREEESKDSVAIMVERSQLPGSTESSARDLLAELAEPAITYVIVVDGARLVSLVDSDQLSMWLRELDLDVDTLLDRLIAATRVTGELRIDEAERRLRVHDVDPNTALSIAFVPSGIRPNQPDTQPKPSLRYRCSNPALHVIFRAAGSTGSLCGEPLSSGQPCPGVLRRY